MAKRRDAAPAAAGLGRLDAGERNRGAGAAADPAPTLVNSWSQERTGRAHFRLALLAPPEPLVLRQEVRVSAPTEHLVLSVSRPLESSPSRIEVRAEGRTLKAFEVQPSLHDRVDFPISVSLHELTGRQVTLEVVQRGQDQRSLSIWDRLELTDEAPRR